MIIIKIEKINYKNAKIKINVVWEKIKIKSNRAIKYQKIIESRIGKK